MPVDTRRLPVPEISKPPEVFTEQLLEGTEMAFNGVRLDGRVKTEYRPVFLKTGILSQARGSAYMELNKTKVICAVYGPREIIRREDVTRTGQLMCEFRYATFSSLRRRPHEPDELQHDYSIIVQEALQPAVILEKFPKARMDVFVTVLEDDGDCVAAAVTCASAALVDAGIEMYDIVVASAVRRCGVHSLLDPVKSEEYLGKIKPNHKATGRDAEDGQITVCYMAALRQVTSVQQLGLLQLDTCASMREVAIEGCENLYVSIKKILTESVDSTLNI